MRNHLPERARHPTLLRLFFVTAAWALLTSNVAWAANQSAEHYQALIRRGTALLQMGMAAEALHDAEQAIRSNSVGWEGYALAGGALVNLKRYQEAADDFTQALKNAPSSKQSGLSDMRRQSLLAAAGVSTPPAAATPSGNGSATNGPSYSETVQWIQSHLGDAQDTTNVDLDPRSGVFALNIDECKTLTFTKTVAETNRDYHIHTPVHGTEIISIPFTSVKSFDGEGGGVGLTVIEPVRDETDISGSDAPVEIKYFDGSLAAVQDSFKHIGVSRFQIVPPGQAVVILSFGRPGTGGEAPHLINALNHLLELCKTHPEQARGLF